MRSEPSGSCRLWVSTDGENLRALFVCGRTPRESRGADSGPLGMKPIADASLWARCNSANALVGSLKVHAGGLRLLQRSAGAWAYRIARQRSSRTHLAVGRGSFLSVLTYAPDA